MTKDQGWDASASWNGYMYQGKVALLIALKTINDKAGATGYWLEMETIEDFSIGVNEQYETIHQVKNRKEEKIEDYQEALSNIIKRIKDYPNISSGYLHTKNEIIVANWDEKIMEMMMDYYPKKIQELNNIVSDAKVQLDVYEEILHQWNEKTKQFDHRIKDIYKQIIYKIEQITDIKKKEDISNELFKTACCQVLEDEKANYTFEKKEEAIKKIKIYKYINNKCFADSIEIIDMTLDEIKRYWANTNEYRVPKIYAYYEELMRLINENITKRAEGGSKKVRIFLEEFRKIMDKSTDLICNNTKEEEILRLKYKYLAAKDDFCGNDICEVKSEGNCQKCRLEEISNYISVCSLFQLEAIFRIMALHKKEELTKKGSELFGKNDLENTLFSGITEIDKDFFLSGCKVLCQIDAKYMMATTISEEKRKRENTIIQGLIENDIQVICQRVLSNDEYDTTFMEVDELLTKAYDTEDIFEKACKIGVVSEDEEDNNLKYMNITKTKKVGLISIERAKEKYGERQ